jgi:hypothetical protein
MERCPAVIQTRRSFLALGLAGLCATRASAASDDAVVLATAEPDPELSLASVQVRKLFLGFTVLHAGHALRPVRNRSDALLDKIFMQHVMAMSAGAYERRLLAMTLQQGRPRPLEVLSRDELIKALLGIPHSVSFAWQSDLDGFPAIHAVRVLWRP